MNAADWVRRWADLRPGDPALIDLATGRRLSWRALHSAASRLAGALAQNESFQHGDRIAVLCSGRAEVFELAVACMAAGLAFTPLNWRLHEEELGGILDDCRPAALVYDPPFAEVAQRLCARRGGLLALNLEEAHAWPGGGQPRNPPPAAPDDVAMILYTSGTTGAPKGAMLSHQQIFFNALNTLHMCDLRPDDRALAFLPLFHTGGLHCLAFPCFYRGATVVLMPRFDPQAALTALAEEAITHTIAVPAMYRMLLDAGLPPKEGLPHLRGMLVGGAPCPPPLLRAYWALGHPLRQGFGMTEVGPNCFTLGPPGDEARIASVGKPALHALARIAGEGGAPLPPGEVGELQLSGPHTTLGYLGRPDATRAAFTTDEAGRRWFRTGDLATVDAEGYYTIVGRSKEMFISGGENVYPAEIERVLADHPSVAEACVVGIPDARWGEVGLAAVELRPGAEASEAALRAHCQGALARYKVPQHLLIVASLPRNATGKVVRKEVAALAPSAA